jgi:hypothetical protein
MTVYDGREERALRTTANDGREERVGGTEGPGITNP